MQMISAARKTAIATLLGAGLLAASQSHAVVVNSGPVNLAIPATTNGIYVNVVTGATGSTSALTTGWDINPWGTAGLGFFSPTAPTGGAYVLSTTSTTANLAVGTAVTSASTFGTGSSAAANATQWNLNSSNNYFGFRFLNEANGQVHYGFAQLAIGSTITTRSLVSYSYESVPGASITVSAVPEPSTYAMMGMGVAGLLLLSRRRKG